MMKRSHPSSRSGGEAEKLPAPLLESRIHLIRGQRVMLDRDLAELYGVPTKVLNQAVRRNISKFPLDFMFQLDREEVAILRSQFVTSSWGGLRYPPYGFAEHGALMAATVLNSPRAIEVSVAIVRAFVRMRSLLIETKDLAHRLDDLESKYDSQFRHVFEAIRELMTPPVPAQRKIGFRLRDKRARYGTRAETTQKRMGS